MLYKISKCLTMASDFCQQPGVSRNWFATSEAEARADWPEDGRAFSCHRFFMENPSLSGRGSAGAADVPRLTHTADGTRPPDAG